MIRRPPHSTPTPEGPVCESHGAVWPCSRCERSEKRERIAMGVVMLLTPLAGLAYILAGLR